MKGYEFERRLGAENSILEPSLRSKFLRILPPDVSHPSHRVGQIRHPIPFLHCETIREDIIGFRTLTVLQNTTLALSFNLKINNRVACPQITNRLRQNI